jgi:hypothetical protein
MGAQRWRSRRPAPRGARERLGLRTIAKGRACNGVRGVHVETLSASASLSDAKDADEGGLLAGTFTSAASSGNGIKRVSTCSAHEVVVVRDLYDKDVGARTTRRGRC